MSDPKSPTPAMPSLAGSDQPVGWSLSISIRLAWRIAPGPKRAAGPVRGAEFVGNAGNADRRVAVAELDA